jgi:large repetitive protein
MRSTHAVTQRLAPRGSIRTRGSRIAASLKILTAGFVAAGSMTALVVAESAQASASTINGIASIADPVTLNVVTSGASTTPFTVSLPPQAACDADTATNGYHVYSYLVPSGTNLSGVTFESFPSTGYGLVDNIGTYYGPVNTAIGTGQVVSIPNGFQWGPLVSNDGVPLSTLLYTGSGSSASGVWEAGLVCANTSGAAADSWNTEVTFHASTSDPNGFTWTAVPGPSGSSPAAFTSANSATFTRGFAGAFTPAASGSPTPVITESGALPAGVTFSGGVLSGTPTVSGTFPITFTATNGIEAAAKQPFTLTVTTAVPSVTSVAPAAGPSAGGTSVVITGTNLGSATSVDFGGSPATVTAASATSITATSPTGSAGTVDVTVTTPGGTSTTSANDLFTYVAAPTVTGIAPASGPSAGGTSVVITGTGLGSATAVDFGSSPASITAGSDTSITATSPTGTGTVDVTVTTTGGVSATSSADVFDYGSAPAFTSAASTTFVKGAAGTFTPAASGSPAPTITERGALPSGVTFAGGVLSGTPTVTGSFPITLTASNGIGGPVDQSFTLNVATILITTTSLPTAHLHTTYSAQLVEVGGTAPFKWTSSVKLPKGLKLDKKTGAITGAPGKKDATGSFPITFTVTDKAKPTKNTASVTITLTVSA